MIVNPKNHGKLIGKIYINKGITMYLMIGVGKLALPVANQLAEMGHDVLAISRSPKADLSSKINFLSADARYLTIQQLADNAEKIQQICITVTPTQYDVQGYKDSYLAICENICELAKGLPHLKRVVYISSTSVYGQNAGEIVDIHSPTDERASPNSQILQQAERVLQETFTDKCTIIRPSGIYGLQRRSTLALANAIKNKQKPIPENTWTNRIFDTDLMAIMVKVLTESQPLPMYLVTDNEPIDLYSVLQYVDNELQLPSNPPKTGKRLQNNLPDGWLQYPTWQHGYQCILANR